MDCKKCHICSVIELADVNIMKKYSMMLRFVRFCDEEQTKVFVLWTNAFHLSVFEIANLYKNR